MFDLFRLPESLGGIFDRASTGTPGLPQALADSGLSLDQIRGMNPQDLVTLLSEKGIDLSRLGSAELDGLAQQIGGETSLVEMLGRLTGRG